MCKVRPWLHPQHAKIKKGGRKGKGREGEEGKKKGRKEGRKEGRKDGREKL
jgi:flagellar biosynthesis/type III secretory pathway protein FliH